MITKKHYKAIADIIADNTDEIDNEILSHYKYVPRNCIVLELADYFAADNPRFDRQKFLDACGL